MARRLLRVLMAVALMSALAMPHALATHDDQKNPPLDTHVPMPTNVPIITNVKAVCSVDGLVHVDDQNNTGGVSATEHNHNHYSFVDVAISCQDAPGDQDYGGIYDVVADGGTDGCLPTAVPAKNVQNCTSLKLDGKIPGHGEWDGLGWSHGSGYNDMSIPQKTATTACDSKKPDNQKGDIWVNRDPGAAKTASGWVKFVREGAEVHAWGCLQWTDGKKKDYFVALLIFIPTDPPGTPKIKNASLIGAAVVGN